MKEKSGNIKIYKRDKENDKISLGNVEFELYSYELDKVIGTYFTDVNGEIYIENLRVGKYKLLEKKTNKWYELTGDIDIVVKCNETTESIVYNELKKGQIKIIKQDKENSNIKLKGVKFNITDSNGKIVDEIITDDKGMAISKNLPINETYIVKEIETLNGYILNPEQIEVTLESKEIRELLFENEKIKSKIKIIKQDKENPEIKLQGVKFNLFNEQNELIEEVITNQEGEAISKFLPINEKYIIKEVETEDGYILNENPIEIFLENKEINTLIIENEKIKGKIKIVKHDSEDSNIYLEGVKFNILNSSGEIIQELITNDKGEAITNELPINKEYVIVEKETLENYVLSDDPIIVKIESDEIKEIKIKNEKIKGKINILKTSSNYNKITGEKKGTPLSGVEFNIYDKNDNIIEKIITDENGNAISNNLLKGQYKVKEICTNENYILNTEIYTVNIESNGQVINLDITNDPINPNIDIEKNGPNEANIGEEINYEIFVKNNGNSQLENFKWDDKIDNKYIKVTNFQTGTYNQKGKYNIYYKTNLCNDEYILLMEDLDTYQNHRIDFIKELSDNEYVTEIIMDFGKVEVGFSSVEKSIVSAKVKEDVRSEDTFINEVNIRGEYNGYLVEDSSRWKTIAYKILPETGF